MLFRRSGSPFRTCCSRSGGSLGRCVRAFSGSSEPQIGSNVFIRHRVRVLWPWKLAVGDNSWIGEDAWILNLEPVAIGHDVCISQGVFLCTGSHDMSSPTFEYDNGPITIDDHAWLGAQAMILRGVTVGEAAVVGARCKVSADVPSRSLLTANGLRSQRR